MNPFELPGPDFLGFYIVLSAVVLLAAWLLRKLLDGSPDPALESPASLLSDPYLIAHLRGGEEETLRVAALSLIDRGLLHIEANGQATLAPNVKPEHGRKAMEQKILAFFDGGNMIQNVWALRNAAAEYDRHLARLRLLPDAEIRGRRLMLFAGTALLLGGVGAVKVMIGLSRGRPVLFLLILMAVAIGCSWRVIQVQHTSHGKRFLRSVQQLLAGLRTRAESIRPGGATADLVLVAAAFGLVTVPLSVAPFRDQLYAPLPPSSGGGGSSDSDSWSSFHSTSSSSSCSSSSCSSSSCGGGGGCGGGGCGGCGS